MVEADIRMPDTSMELLPKKRESSCHASTDIDREKYIQRILSPDLLEILLKDHTTKSNIFWATDNYADRGEGYQFSDPITIESITGENSSVIIPRALKSRQQQQQRSREMAEVFTPSWICNKQNNLIDNAWFGREDVFNTEIDNPDGSHSWIPSTGKIEFLEGKTWRDYVTENIIVDEAHEGTQTKLGKAVMAELTKKDTKVLRLSGTPFNLLDDFKEDEIYTWDYVMEQRAKAQWDELHPGDHNPYAGLPRLNIYTYDLGRLMNEYANEDIAFNFREFFRTKDDGEFVHKHHVENFLNLLTKTDEESMYPFANKRYRDIFRHNLWMVPGVKSAKALSTMLKNHPVFGMFEVANVAGDGDEEEANEEALRKGEKAIGKDPDKTRTITLSCGRLTTGVSVKPWTGVLMLSGSFNTAASAYMQTIFRVQTPATINGRVKEDCYVFDFAPDRTLKVLAETAKISRKAGKQGESDRRQLGEFLNFCPIISVEGSQMKQLNTEHMLQQLKRVYVERVVQNGFEDGYLYNDELLKLSDVDISKFDKLKGIIGQTKAMGKSNDININDQGLTNEEYAEKEKLEKKKKRELTEEEKARLAELKAKKEGRDKAISILRGISIRMPLLIYGAKITDEDKELTIIVGRFVPSNGEMSVKPGEGYRVLTEPKILLPKEINTETYIDTAVFGSEVEAKNHKTYLFSKFARYLLRQGVTSVNVTRECFAFVPTQDFTVSSDIDWSKSVEEIDKQLYKKYKLSDTEIAFIESMIKPM